MPLTVMNGSEEFVPVIVKMPPNGTVAGEVVIVGGRGLICVVAVAELFVESGSVEVLLTLAVTVSNPPQPVPKKSSRPS